MTQKYKVAVPYIVWAYVDVEADSEEDAIYKAIEASGLSSYAGNGGSNKLIGTRMQNVSLEPADESYEGPNGLEAHIFDTEW